MPRRNVQRIRDAQRAGLRARMVDQWRVLPRRADELLDAWEDVARERGLTPEDDRFSQAREAWLREQTGR